jgi:hypothetical protein
MTAQFMGQFHSSDFRRCECKANLQNSASPGSFRKRSKQWPVPGRETEKLAYVRAGNFGRFWRLWAIIDVSESGVVRLNGPKTSPERTHPQPLRDGLTASVLLRLLARGLAVRDETRRELAASVDCCLPDLLRVALVSG